MNNPKFEIYKSAFNSQFYFRLKASNGQIILSSEGYVMKQSCQHGIASVKMNAPHDERYERKNGTTHYTFNLKASNGEIIGRSESYVTPSNRDQGIEAVKKYAPISPIEDLS